MGDDDDGVLVFQIGDQILNLGGGDGIQGGGGLVHQQDVGLHRQGPGDAQALLLAAGQAQGGLFQAILHLVPDGRALEGLLHNVVQLALALDAVGAGTVGHVVIDGHGEGIGLLEHHADLLAQPRHVHAGVVDLDAPVLDGAGDLDTGHQVVHPIQGLEEGGLAAAGGADEGRHLLLGDVHAHVLEGLRRAVPEVQPLG